MRSSEPEKIAHLLRRAGFEPTPEEVAGASAAGVTATVDRLLDPAADGGSARAGVEPHVPEPKPGERPIPAAARDALLASGPWPEVRGKPLDLTRPLDLQTWWLHRMATTTAPLLERMTLFWHGHFATALRTVNSTGLMLLQNQLLRRHALGNFRQLLRAISRDPAMLIFLNGNSNRRQAPNENYARELFELFTMGIGNYSEQDVAEAARAFTGWSIDKEARFVARRAWHDPGSKTVLGRVGSWDGDDVIDIVAARPETAAFISRKLFAHFAHPDPDEAALQPLIQAYFESGYEVRPMLRALFLSEAFYSERARRAVVKSPAEFAVGVLRQLELPLQDRVVALHTQRMGQELFNPPNVAGWPGGRAWLNASTMLGRIQFARYATSLLGSPKGVPVSPRLEPPPDVARSPRGLVDHWLRRFGLHADATPQTRQALERYAASLLAARAGPLELARELAQMVMSSPEYQMA